MKSYYIEERDMEMTYIELRILMYVDCNLKYEKITEILNFLNYHGFINHLTMLYAENMRAENIPERKNVMSLTIDTRDDKLRYKFWNGATTMWLFHTQDLLDALDTGRENFVELYDKYEPVTEALLNFKNRWSTSIYHISYQYYPDDDIELVYNIIFTKEVKDTNYATKLLNKINKEITMLGEDITQDLNFRIEHSFDESTCTPCEAARKEREKNELEG